MSYFVYILQSEIDGSFYIGYTSDLSHRLTVHNSGKTRYTSKKCPWKIVYTEKFAAKSDVIRREKFLINQKNREFYQRLIDSQTNL